MPQRHRNTELLKGNSAWRESSNWHELFPPKYSVFVCHRGMLKEMSIQTSTRRGETRLEFRYLVAHEGTEKDRRGPDGPAGGGRFSIQAGRSRGGACAAK